MSTIENAVTKLKLDHPFFGKLADRLKFVETDEFLTVATDGKNIFYNQDYINQLTDDEVVYTVASRIHSNIHNHIERSEGKNLHVWNMACEYVNNLSLVGLGVGVAPEDLLYDERFNDMTSDEVYDVLMKEQTDEVITDLVEKAVEKAFPDG